MGRSNQKNQSSNKLSPTKLKNTDKQSYIMDNKQISPRINTFRNQMLSNSELSSQGNHTAVINTMPVSSTHHDDLS